MNYLPLPSRGATPLLVLVPFMRLTLFVSGDGGVAAGSCFMVSVDMGETSPVFTVVSPGMSMLFCLLSPVPHDAIDSAIIVASTIDLYRFINNFLAVQIHDLQQVRHSAQKMC